MNYIALGDNIVYFQKGLGSYLGKIVDFYKNDFGQYVVYCRFNRMCDLYIPVKNLIFTENFWLCIDK